MLAQSPFLHSYRCHIPDFLKPITDEGLSAVWRDRLAELPSAEPAIRDRDAKLLAWLEYSELLADGMWILSGRIEKSH